MKVEPFFNIMITLAFAAILLGMGGFAIWGVRLSQAATTATNTAVYLSDQYQQARYWVGAEESLERLYRLEPGPSVLASHRAAEQAIIQNMQHVIRVGSQTDQRTARTVLVDHVHYVTTSNLMFAAVDTGKYDQVQQIDDKLDDPEFEIIQALVNNESNAHHSAAELQLANLQDLQNRIALMTPLVFIVGCLFLFVLWRILNAYRRGLDMLHSLEVARLAEAALTDSLTGLGNHRAFQEAIQREIHHAVLQTTSLYLALLDIDEFKVVNDTNGHAYGDTVLAALGQRLQQRYEPSRVFRLGGDEFALLLPLVSLVEAQTMLASLRTETREILAGATLSIGLAALEGPDADRELLQAQADAALYEAKRRGRNEVITFADVRDDVTILSAKQVHALRHLLEEPHIQVVFQPIWDVSRKRLLAVEALSRPDAAYGFAGPQEAFDIAERIGRAQDLDTCCRHAILQQSTTLGLAENTLLFINVSPQSLDHHLLQDNHLVEEVAAAGLTPEQVVLEITERSIVRLDVVIHEVARLRGLGFKIALDDTGAGNAGLEMLSNMAVDFVKIDRGVVVKALTDAAARGVLAGIIAIARETNSYVIAEGIEDMEMLELVHRFSMASQGRGGIQGVQGYLLGRPSISLPNGLPPALWEADLLAA